MLVIKSQNEAKTNKDELDRTSCCGAPQCRAVETCVSDETAVSVAMFLQSAVKVFAPLFFSSYNACESVWCWWSTVRMKCCLLVFPRRAASSLCLVSHRTLIPALRGPWTPRNPAAAPPTLPPQPKASSKQDNIRVKHFPSCISQLLFALFFPLCIWVFHWTLHKLNNYLLHLYFFVFLLCLYF